MQPIKFWRGTALKIYYVLIMEGPQAKKVLFSALADSKGNFKRAWNDFRTLLSTDKQVLLMGNELARAQTALNQKADSFVRQVNDFLPVQILPKQEAFRVLKRILNFTPLKLEHAQLKHDTFLDYYLWSARISLADLVN